MTTRRICSADKNYFDHALRTLTARILDNFRCGSWARMPGTQHSIV
jgi:hypothetical protein